MANTNKQSKPLSLDPEFQRQRKQQQRKYVAIDKANQAKRMAEIRELTIKRGKNPNKLSEHPSTPKKDIKAQTRNIRSNRNKKCKSKTKSDLPQVKFKRKFTPASNNTIAYRRAPPTKVTPNKNIKYGRTEAQAPRQPTPEPTEEEKERKKKRKEEKAKRKKQKNALGF